MKKASVRIGILFIFLVLPIEFYIYGVFIRPIYIGATLYFALSLYSNRFRFKTYIGALSDFLIVYLLYRLAILVTAVYHGLYFIAAKEFVETISFVLVSVAICNAYFELGSRVYLRRQLFWAVVLLLLFVLYNLYIDNYPTFKDPYWINLIVLITASSLYKVKPSRTLGLLLIFSSLVGFVSGSRTYILNFFVSMILILRKRFLLLVPFIVVIIPVISLVPQYTRYLDTIYVLLSSSSDFIDRLLVGDAQGISNKSDFVRLSHLFHSIDFAMEFPIFGVGWEQYQSYMSNLLGRSVVVNAHNEWIRVLAEGGLFVFIPFFFMHFRVYKFIRSLGKHSSMSYFFFLSSVLTQFVTPTNFVTLYFLFLAYLLARFDEKIA